MQIGLGAACPVKYGEANWGFLTGNQLGVLMGEWLLQNLVAAGKLDPRHFIVKTFVTSNMLVRLAESYGIRAITDVLTGFKWIGYEMDRNDPAWFVLGTEEAHGYLAGTHIRDKDAAVAALLLAEYAATIKQQGRTLFDELDRLYRRVGLHQEKSFALTLPGADGMERMQKVMHALRHSPPKSIAGIAVAQMRDYDRQLIVPLVTERFQGVDHATNGCTTNEAVPLAGSHSDLIFLDLAVPEHAVAIRPSGTEPKLKFYLFTALLPGESTDLPAAKRLLQERLASMETDLRTFVAEVP